MKSDGNKPGRGVSPVPGQPSRSYGVGIDRPPREPGSFSVALLSSACSKEAIMAFTKTSVALTSPRLVTPPPFPEIGDMRDGKVWDGKDWVTEDEWKTQRLKEG